MHLEGQKDEQYKRTDKARLRLEWQVQHTSVRNSRRETKKNEREANIQRENDWEFSRIEERHESSNWRSTPHPKQNKWK